MAFPFTCNPRVEKFIPNPDIYVCREFEAVVIFPSSISIFELLISMFEVLEFIRVRCEFNVEVLFEISVEFEFISVELEFMLELLEVIFPSLFIISY